MRQTKMLLMSGVLAASLIAGCSDNPTTEALPHSVQSLGSPSFTSSGVQTGSGSTYHVTFTAPGTYQYDCAVHGSMMTGRIVVLAAGTSSSASPPPSSSPPPGY